MTILSIILLFKIAITSLAVAFPFLALPSKRLEAAIRIRTSNPLIYRLYGVAILALLIGYGFGVKQAEEGIFPSGVITMGLVSNSGAAFFLILSKSGKHNLFIGYFFGVIAIALFVAMIFPSAAVSR
jgi:hypothetical protein